ncbi:hypothetical protein QE394_001092 [Arthrobacter sp. SORGH_AS 212]|uniref:M23 family metallopeptidase n=1 Tax=Pseudarthrobacter sp. SORGH_AS 212 TaxID=3041777 RepID=UPI00277E3C7A|nr:hypothetical protein [Arthrobacter sp. SORGH_AS_0212]
MIHPVAAAISQRFGDNPTRSLPASSWLIQTFGNYQPDGHTGIDYACDPGTAVRAVAAGTVLHIGWMSGTYEQNPWWIVPSFAGYCAVIDHGSFIGIYGHCQDGSAKVSKDARVSEGQVFILSGNTGGSTGPHLHFEALPDGWVLNSKYYGRIDPAPLLSAAIQTQSASVTPAPAVQPKEWDEMASKEEIAAVTWGGPGGTMIHNYRLGRGEYPQTTLGALEGRIQNEILPAALAPLQGAVAGLVGALKAVTAGEAFDEAKLLAGVQAAAEAGVKNAIESIDTTVTIKQEGAQ